MEYDDFVAYLKKNGAKLLLSKPKVAIAQKGKQVAVVACPRKADKAWEKQVKDTCGQLKVTMPK